MKIAVVVPWREQTSLNCAYWGRLDDEPYVTHIGDYKLGTDY